MEHTFQSKFRGWKIGWKNIIQLSDVFMKIISDVKMHGLKAKW
jgi:hypothetical protein